MLEQKGFRGKGADATRTQEFRQGDKQVERQEEQIAHESNIITAANPCKTARHGPFGLEFTNSHPTGCGRQNTRGLLWHSKDNVYRLAN